MEKKKKEMKRKKKPISPSETLSKYQGPGIASLTGPLNSQCELSDASRVNQRECCLRYDSKQQSPAALTPRGPGLWPTCAAHYTQLEEEAPEVSNASKHTWLNHE